MKKSLFIIFILGISLLSFSQEEEKYQELSKLRESYLNLDAFSVDVKYRLYIGEKTTPAETFISHFVRKGKQYKLTSKDQEEIRNKKLLFKINHIEKIAILQKGLDTIKNEADPSSIDIEILLNLAYESFAIKNLNAGEKGYRFKFYNSPYEVIDIIYNPSNYFIKKIILYPSKRQPEDKEQKLEVIYYNMKTNPSLTSTTFSTAKYLTITEGKASLKSNYKDYTLID